METLKTLTVCQDWLDQANEFFGEPGNVNLGAALEMLRTDHADHMLIGPHYVGQLLRLDVEASQKEGRLVVTPL